MNDKSGDHQGDKEDDTSAFKKISNTIVMRKIKTKDVQAFLGCANRSPITGLISLVNVDEANDFSIVDLWTRTYIEGTAGQMIAEKHLFKPKVLENRTWLYHKNFDSRKNEHDAGEAEPCVRYALESKAIDMPGNTGGRWSPMMCTVFMLPMVSFTGSLLLTFMAAIVFLSTLFISIQMNAPGLLQYGRFITLPFRIGFLLFMMTYVSFASLDEGRELLKLSTLVLTFLIGVYDVFTGDLSCVLSFSQTARYEIIQELPMRVYVCRLVGTPTTPHKRETIDKSITGMRNWDSSPDLRLVADVHGLLCELHPLTFEDWEKLLNFTRRTGEELRFAGINLFNLQRQSLESHTDPDHFVSDPLSLFVQLKDGRLITTREAKEMRISPSEYMGMS